MNEYDLDFYNRFNLLAYKEREEKWHRRFLDVASLISTWSKDPSTKVGVVIVKDNKILGTGYNGFPRGIEDSEDRYNDRPTKYKFVVHAEVNAILNSVANVTGADLYLWPAGPPCCECTKVIIQSGIKRVIARKPQADPFPTWRENFETSKNMLLEAGIKFIEIED